MKKYFAGVLISILSATPMAAIASELDLPTDPAKREEVLKKGFLDCDKLSREIALDGGDAALCSAVYEALLKEVFKGDFQKLLEWWQANKLPTDPTPPAEEDEASST
ncbi:MAG: hypothetical protein AB7N80_08190 [Bdellovibrionales bacterium]